MQPERLQGVQIVVPGADNPRRGLRHPVLVLSGHRGRQGTPRLAFLGPGRHREFRHLRFEDTKPVDQVGFGMLVQLKSDHDFSNVARQAPGTSHLGPGTCPDKGAAASYLAKYFPALTAAPASPKWFNGQTNWAPIMGSADANSCALAVE